MVVADAAVPAIYAVHSLLWVVNAVAFGFFLRSSLSYLNPQVAEKTKETQFCGFLSIVHFLAFLCFVAYAINAVDTYFYTNLIFPNMQLNCQIVTMIGISMFIFSKFAQYAFFIYRLRLFSDKTEKSDFAVDNQLFNRLRGYLLFYVVGFEGFAILFSVTTPFATRSQPLGSYAVCDRHPGFALAPALCTIWFLVLDSTMMTFVGYSLGWRLIQYREALKLLGKGDDDVMRVIRRTFQCFVAAMVSAIVLGVLMLAYPNDLFWFNAPSWDMWINCMCVEVSVLTTFGDDGLFDRGSGFALTKVELANSPSN